jgi:NADPH:quinone reductase-like Zn-dependent oxidoreductase
LSGEVEAVGAQVTGFKPGDAVLATTGLKMGAYAEYLCLPETSKLGVIAHKSDNLSWEEAAALPTGGLEALHYLQKAKIQPGQKLLIIGAGGSIGSFGIQIARYFGAEVTAVDRTDKLDLLRLLGVEHVIDYTQADFTRNGQTYDVIFDVVGKGSLRRKLKSLAPSGYYLLVNYGLSSFFQKQWTSRTTDKKIVMGTSGRNPEDIKLLCELAAMGKIKSVIDRTYPLAEVKEAHRYVETGAKKGNVAIIVIPTSQTTLERAD